MIPRDPRYWNAYDWDRYYASQQLAMELKSLAEMIVEVTFMSVLIFLSVVLSILAMEQWAQGWSGSSSWVACSFWTPSFVEEVRCIFKQKISEIE